MNTERLNSTVIDTCFQNWIADLEERRFAELTFSELSRALRALSWTYVERRDTIARGGALSVRASALRLRCSTHRCIFAAETHRTGASRSGSRCRSGR
jgi:hypothetical protein